MCISCGNCSTYCEMGLDVRQYAMANQTFKRAACVGCGMCAHVCSRGVLRLETKPDRFRAGTPIRVFAVDL
jgi:Pyruvate/2-oxoacid:ferredoxin oxidoreductase delta subunit